MKAKYSKPIVKLISFELSQNISAGCEMISNAAPTVCPVEIPEWGGLTYIGETTCELDTPGENDEICYHAPSDNSNVFSS